MSAWILAAKIQAVTELKILFFSQFRRCCIGMERYREKDFSCIFASMELKSFDRELVQPAPRDERESSQQVTAAFILPCQLPQ